MKLNTLSCALGSRKNAARCGRGIGSGLGKTSGRGHKGQKARAGGFHKINFEGGQMPIQRRLPKMGFKSRKSDKVHVQVTLTEINNVAVDIIDLEILKAHGVVNRVVKSVKVISSGKIMRALSLRGLNLTKGAREEILKIGGNIEY